MCARACAQSVNHTLQTRCVGEYRRMKPAHSNMCFVFQDVMRDHDSGRCFKRSRAISIKHLAGILSAVNSLQRKHALFLFVSLKRGALLTRAPQAGPSLSPKLRRLPSERGPRPSTLRRKTKS